MKGFLTTASWVLVLLAALSCSAQQNCPFPDPVTHVVFFPHPDDCTKFYMCSNGVPIEQICPSGLHFNPSKFVCDWPQDANCNANETPECPSSGFLPHPSSCSKYYQCANGIFYERECPGNLHFNPILNICDWEQNANCVIGCEKLSDDPHGTWTPSSCSSDVSDIGAKCSLRCNGDYVLKGSSFVQCTEDGWNSTNGNFIPKCVPEECIGEEIENELNKTLSVEASLLFVLDESGSVGTENFRITKEVVKDIISAFPLSANRSSGVITFASNSLIPIPLRTADTPDFMKKVDAIRYRTGGTNILDALETAYNVIKSQQVHPLTLVFLITDGESQTDGTSAANKIKGDNHPLFTIGIGNTMLEHLEDLSSTGTNNIKHFFHLRDYTVLQAIGEYLNPSKGSQGSGGSNSQCSP